jgi:hypothetical protein
VLDSIRHRHDVVPAEAPVELVDYVAEDE